MLVIVSLVSRQIRAKVKLETEGFSPLFSESPDHTVSVHQHVITSDSSDWLISEVQAEKKQLP